MENNAKMLESLLEKAEDFAITSYELAKLKALDKTSDIVSSFIPHSIVFVLLASFMVFLNLGLAFWLGEIMGETYFGFFVVAGFYVLTAMIFFLFFSKQVKKNIANSIINQMLK